MILRLRQRVHAIVEAIDQPIDRGTAADPLEHGDCDVALAHPRPSLQRHAAQPEAARFVLQHRPHRIDQTRRGGIDGKSRCVHHRRRARIQRLAAQTGCCAAPPSRSGRRPSGANRPGGGRGPCAPRARPSARSCRTTTGSGRRSKAPRRCRRRSPAPSARCARAAVAAPPAPCGESLPGRRAR